ncbi:hypothetical protein JKV81_09490 [Streptomyces sp. For3]|uniref:hypothetical protein n=1 Tax=Streptomyces silvae TaxID=2803812 RepID=UPI001921454E|nr:hypothetical protein [Streptomyces silvae]MBL1287077.1 hypothetical protein [Streptomyces silvae]
MALASDRAMSLAESVTECDVPEWSTPIAELLHEWKLIYSGLRLDLRHDLAPDSVRRADVLSRRWRNLSE